MEFVNNELKLGINVDIIEVTNTLIILNQETMISLGPTIFFLFNF